MIELIQITNDPALARRCDALDGIRLWVDLERMGKSERQAGRNTFISEHTLEDVGRVASVLRRARLMVRVNPLHAGTAAEVESVLAQGASLLMLPMFRTGAELREFCHLVEGRVPVVALLETSEALESLDEWVGTPGLQELYVGLNDLHLSLRLRFMFEPLATGLVERIANTARAHGLAFGFGGIARLDGGLLPGRDVLAEHLRLGSGSVILSRTFHQGGAGNAFESEVAALRDAETQMRRRNPEQVAGDARRIASRILEIASSMGQMQ